MIDLDKWKTNPLEGPVRQKVKSSMASLINEKTLELIEFIRDTEHASGSKAGLENTFVKLFVDYRAGVIGDTLLRAAPEMEQEDLDEVISALEFASDHVRLDASMIRANINISPYRQQEMYDTLSAYMGRVDPQGLVPVHPLSSEASERTKFIFEIISRVFEKRNDGSYTYFAQLAMSWMRGGTYREIIGSAIEYRRGIGRRESDQAIIRNVLREINNDLKFKYVKYTRGYINMLIASLAGAGQSVPEDAVVDMPIYLELGASSSTMISLISLGLSRTTASILSGMAPSSGWSREEVLEWLRRRRFMTAELPARCRREVDALSLQAHG